MGSQSIQQGLRIQHILCPSSVHIIHFTCPPPLFSHLMHSGERFLLFQFFHAASEHLSSLSRHSPGRMHVWRIYTINFYVLFQTTTNIRRYHTFTRMTTTNHDNFTWGRERERETGSFCFSMHLFLFTYEISTHPIPITPFVLLCLLDMRMDASEHLDWGQHHHILLKNPMKWKELI